ncbi:MAG TPA: cytochrome c oxidase, cbb3-type, CcoQ subunit [Sulfurovum sp.]|nr:cytochrome c oxidase, cbb3-type, CcoQ subunit [Sulfurovum sp.]
MNLAEVQGYIYLVMTVVMVAVLYSYILYLYRGEKSGEKDYEKYGKIALDDSVDSKPIEDMPEPKNEK